MAYDETLAELAGLRRQAQVALEGVEERIQALDSGKHELRRVVGEYNRKRAEIITLEMQKRGVVWCTDCFAATPEAHARFMFLEGVEEYDADLDRWGTRPFAQLHRLCRVCRRKAEDRHGWQGPYDSHRNRRAHFYAHSAEKLPDRYRVRKLRTSMDLFPVDKGFHLLATPEYRVDQLAEEWKLPPRLKVDERSATVVQLVIRGRAATAVAT